MAPSGSRLRVKVARPGRPSSPRESPSLTGLEQASDGDGLLPSTPLAVGRLLGLTGRNAGAPLPESRTSDTAAPALARGCSFVSDAEAIRQRSDSVPLVPLQTDPLTGADAAPPHPRADVPGPRDGADPPQESMFGPYRLQELIGRGGMGEVYRAYDTSRGRVVALKRLPAALAADPMFQARFRSEAALAARLHEPHVIPIHDFGEIDGQLYIDMRLVDGPDLATVTESGPLPPQPGRGHRHAGRHRAGCRAHRRARSPRHQTRQHADRPPRRRRPATSSTSRTSASPARSTAAPPARSPPPAPRSARWTTSPPNGSTATPATGASDIYALGCVLFQALTAEKPFPVEGLPAIINAHLNTPPPAPTARRPGLPAGLDAVVARAMAKNPDHRYPSAAALALDARRALDGETVVVAPNLSARTTPPDQRAHSRAPWLDSAVDSYSRVTGPVAPGTFPPSSPAPARAPSAVPEVRDVGARWFVGAVTLRDGPVGSVPTSVPGRGARPALRPPFGAPSVVPRRSLRCAAASASAAGCRRARVDAERRSTGYISWR